MPDYKLVPRSFGKRTRRMTPRTAVSAEAELMASIIMIGTFFLIISVMINICLNFNADRSQQNVRRTRFENAQGGLTINVVSSPSIQVNGKPDQLGRRLSINRDGRQLRNTCRASCYGPHQY